MVILNLAESTMLVCEGPRPERPSQKFGTAKGFARVVMSKDPLDMALPDEDFDGDYHGDEAFELKGTEELAMDYAVFGRYVKSAQSENGKPVFLGPKTEGSRPSIAFTTIGDGKPTWWICDASGGECFYAEADSDMPPREGWRKEYCDDDLKITLEAVEGSGEDKGQESRGRSRSPRREQCPW
ncbi:unnamed protein product [Effrenium voratum]|nr:unnamed protein product [Effrenium voratum]